MKSSTPLRSDSMAYFGVPLESLPLANTVSRIRTALEKGERLRIATVNPEFLLEARTNPRFRESLRKADLRVADGFGVIAVSQLFGKRLKRIAGADLMIDALRVAEDAEATAVLLVNDAGLSSFDEIRAVLRLRYPKLQITRFEPGVEVPEKSLILCNYGAPLQELTLEQLPGSGVRIGVGGAFDYLTGKLLRAPKILQRLGLEWFWRLLQQPKRFNRIWRAVVVFPILAVFDTIRR